MYKCKNAYLRGLVCFWFLVLRDGFVMILLCNKENNNNFKLYLKLIFNPISGTS